MKGNRLKIKYKTREGGKSDVTVEMKCQQQCAVAPKQTFYFPENVTFYFFKDLKLNGKEH